MLANAPIYPVLAASDLARARSRYADKLALQPAMELDGALIYWSEAFRAGSCRPVGPMLWRRPRRPDGLTAA